MAGAHDGMTPPAAALNVAISTDEEQPLGLLALVNSTLSHTSSLAPVHFHLIVPDGMRRPLRVALEGLFPAAVFRAYSLDGGGVRAKILHHLRRREREPVFVSPFRFAAAYLPQLLPAVRRVLWLHTDVLIRSDVEPLFRTPLRGAPAAAAEDCAHPLSAVLNASHVALGGAGLAPTACTFNSGIMLIDLQQWSHLDLTSRVEYWMDQNLRTSTLYAHETALPPLLLALLPLYAKLPLDWNVAGLGRRKLSGSERTYWAKYWTARGAAYDAPADGPTLALVRAGGALGDRARALHFSGVFKPWFKGGGGGGQGGGAPVSECEVGDPPLSSTRVPCASLWAPYAAASARTLGWAAPNRSEAAARAERAVALAAATEPQDRALTPLLEGGGAEVAALPVTVAIASGSAAPYGAVAAINSTLAHASAATRRRLRIHVFTPADVHDAISRKLGRIFAAGADGVPSIAVRPAPVERLAKLASRLAAIGVSVPPFEMPLLWLPATLGPEVSRALVLADDAVLLTDAAELHDVALGPKKVGAAIEECATTFETLFNYHHATFNGHSRSSCAFDAGVATLDLKAWRREDLSTRIIELMGQQRKVDQLYVHGASGLSAAVPTLLALDKRLLRLPSRWLARGLARDSWSHGELAYWQRYWGQQGEKLPFVPRPLRAPHATAAPRREIGDALVLRFSGSLFADGRFKPWLRRCSGEAADGAPRCGRRGLDCARLWWRYFSERALPLVEAAVTDDKLKPNEGAALGCVAPDPNGPPEKREWFDPETFLAPERGRGKGGGADAKGEILETFTDPTTGKRMVRRRVKVKHAAG